MAKIAAFATMVMLGASVSSAQNRMMTGSVAHAPAAHATASAPSGTRTTVRISGGGFNRGFHSRRFGRSGFYGYGYGWPYGYSEYDGYEEVPVVPPQPAAAPAPTVQFKEEPVASPALLELQGGQWVQVRSFITGTASAEKGFASQSASNEVAPAVLIYRDGRSEEVSSYSIIGDTIYTKADYYASGSWERKIQIADLDIPATLKQNRDRGVKFELPSGPNEVMLRP